MSLLASRMDPSSIITTKSNFKQNIITFTGVYLPFPPVFFFFFFPWKLANILKCFSLWRDSNLDLLSASQQDKWRWYLILSFLSRSMLLQWEWSFQREKQWDVFFPIEIHSWKPLGDTVVAMITELSNESDRQNRFRSAVLKWRSGEKRCTENDPVLEQRWRTAL